MLGEGGLEAQVDLAWRSPARSATITTPSARWSTERRRRAREQAPAAEAERRAARRRCRARRRARPRASCPRRRRPRSPRRAPARRRARRRSRARRRPRAPTRSRRRSSAARSARGATAAPRSGRRASGRAARAPNTSSAMTASERSVPSPSPTPSITLGEARDGDRERGREPEHHRRAAAGARRWRPPTAARGAPGSTQGDSAVPAPAAMANSTSRVTPELRAHRQRVDQRDPTVRPLRAAFRRERSRGRPKSGHGTDAHQPSADPPRRARRGPPHVQHRGRVVTGVHDPRHRPRRDADRQRRPRRHLRPRRQRQAARPRRRRRAARRRRPRLLDGGASTTTARRAAVPSPRRRRQRRAAATSMTCRWRRAARHARARRGRRRRRRRGATAAARHRLLISCGSGRDTATADDRDPRAHGCETADGRSAAGGPVDQPRRRARPGRRGTRRSSTASRVAQRRPGHRDGRHRRHHAPGGRHGRGGDRLQRRGLRGDVFVPHVPAGGSAGGALTCPARLGGDQDGDEHRRRAEPTTPDAA